MNDNENDKEIKPTITRARRIMDFVLVVGFVLLVVAVCVWAMVLGS